MNINKIDNTNFKAIYRLPYSEKNLAIINKEILPTYSRVTNQCVGVFKGEHPLKMSLIGSIEKISKNLNYSADWLKTNATNHGADRNSMELNYMCVITGEKDTNALTNFLKSRVLSAAKENKQMNSIFYKIKNLFIEKSPKEIGFDENTPVHLRELFAWIKNDKDEQKIFEEAFPKIISVNSPEELFIKMMSER